jgi:hypothetical protein
VAGSWPPDLSSAPEYDVAVSFLSEDEGTARDLAKVLDGQLRVYLYSERQIESAGQDGIDLLSRIFRRDARVVVILHRAKWGCTKWTRIEETAITEGGFERGFGFVVLTPLERAQRARRHADG